MEYLAPAWPAPPKVRALATLRAGGASRPPYDGFNLGDHVGDDPAAVAANRAELRAVLPGAPLWLRQVHGARVVDAGSADGVPEADGSVARRAGTVCAVMTADCLPLLLCDRAGTVVGAAHAGWRGLAGGVVEATVRAMAVAPEDLLVWLGPAIGPHAFEVGGEVRETFMRLAPEAASAFLDLGGNKWLADIYLLARQHLARAGVTEVHGGEYCTYTDAARFYSYRRDGVTGRMASLVWLQP